jgi:hypothetical protein
MSRRRSFIQGTALAVLSAVSVAGVVNALPYQHTYYSTEK